MLAFKGGMALRRSWFADYRFSEDLDFTLIRSITFGEILAGLKGIFATIENACGLRIAFDREDRLDHQNSHTFLPCATRGLLPAANDVKVDITILCFPLVDRTIHRSYNGFDDLPEGPTAKVYALEEIVIEPAGAERSRQEFRPNFPRTHRDKLHRIVGHALPSTCRLERPSGL